MTVGLTAAESKEFYRMDDAIRARKRRSEATAEHREARLEQGREYDNKRGWSNKRRRQK